MTYLYFAPANFATANGLGIDDNRRMGVFIGTASVVIANFYVLMNSYRWDWLLLLIVAISTLLIWFWTGVYTTSTYGFLFYKAAPEVYGQLSFWAVILVSAVIGLLPRFAVKSFRKMFFPTDVDIIREQVSLGQFEYLKDTEGFVPPKAETVMSMSSDETKVAKAATTTTIDEDQRPIYPPSVAPTNGTHNARSQNGSDSTNCTLSRPSNDVPQAQSRPQSYVVGSPRSPIHSPFASTRGSFERPRHSFERARQSMDRIRPSFEASNDFTSAAMLTRMESSQSAHEPSHMSRLRNVIARRES